MHQRSAPPAPQMMYPSAPAYRDPQNTWSDAPRAPGVHPANHGGQYHVPIGHPPMPPSPQFQGAYHQGQAGAGGRMHSPATQDYTNRTNASQPMYNPPQDGHFDHARLGPPAFHPPPQQGNFDNRMMGPPMFNPPPQHGNFDNGRSGPPMFNPSPWEGNFETRGATDRMHNVSPQHGNFDDGHRRQPEPYQQPNAQWNNWRPPFPQGHDARQPVISNPPAFGKTGGPSRQHMQRLVILTWIYLGLCVAGVLLAIRASTAGTLASALILCINIFEILVPFFGNRGAREGNRDMMSSYLIGVGIFIGLRLIITAKLAFEVFVLSVKNKITNKLVGLSYGQTTPLVLAIIVAIATVILQVVILCIGYAYYSSLAQGPSPTHVQETKVDELDADSDSSF